MKRLKRELPYTVNRTFDIIQENVFLDTRNISYGLISGVSSELNEFFGSDGRIKSYTHFAEESIYKIQIELNDEDSPKHVLVREIFFDFISFMAYSAGGTYSIEEKNNTFFCSFLTYTSKYKGIYFQITFIVTP